MLLRERMKLIGWFLSHDLLCACGILLLLLFILTAVFIQLILVHCLRHSEKFRCFYLDAARTRLEKNERVASIMSAHTARLHLK